MWEYKNIKVFLQRSYAQNWSEEVFVIKKVKNIASWTYIISDLNGEEIAWKFYEKNFKRQIGKSKKKKGDKLYVKWKGYNNAYNSCIHKKILWCKMSYFPEPCTDTKTK